MLCDGNLITCSSEPAAACPACARLQEYLTQGRSQALATQKTGVVF